MAKKNVTAEALLRRRLSPSQEKDLDKTGSFCVTSKRLTLLKYRICVLDGPPGFGPLRFVIDVNGQWRNLWFVQDIRHYGRPLEDMYEQALAAMLLLEADPASFEDHACHEGYPVIKKWWPKQYRTSSPKTTTKKETA